MGPYGRSHYYHKNKSSKYATLNELFYNTIDFIIGYLDSSFKNFVVISLLFLLNLLIKFPFN